MSYFQTYLLYPVLWEWNQRKGLQSVMGHADINTTMDIYAEVTEAKKRESMENLSKNLKVF